MDRVGVFIDAGYLFSGGSEAQVGEPMPRGQIQFQAAKCISFLQKKAVEITGLPVLRVYWYDGTSAGPTEQQKELAFTHDVKVRLGSINPFGQQKGVDSLLITDMINLARNGAFASAVLMAGDEDVRVAVQQAQEFGVRVYLLGIEVPGKQNLSPYLVQEVDEVTELTGKDLEPFLQAQTPIKLALQAGASQKEIADQVVQKVVEIEEKSGRLAELAAGFSLSRNIPRDVDSSLMGSYTKHLNLKPYEQIPEEMKFYIRDEFRDAVLSRASAETDGSFRQVGEKEDEEEEE